MIKDRILDEILPVKDLGTLKEELVEELKEEGFAITNFQPGGIFYHLLMILCQVKIELTKLLRLVLNNMFITHASGTWLDLKAADFTKERKSAIKTRGLITLYKEAGAGTVKVAKGYVFKTDRDVMGEELRYRATETTILAPDTSTGTVLVEAETAGSRYNAAPGQITKCLIHMEGIFSITNEAGWITKEGADEETDESLRSRTLGAWAELSTLPIRDKYKNVCEGVPGVLYVNVLDQHPRGQGTVDIIVTGTAGEATEGLLDKVRTAAEEIKGPYDDLLIYSSATVTQDITVTLTANDNTGVDGMGTQAEEIILEIMKRQKGRNMNELYKAEIIWALKDELPVKNVQVLIPDEDVILMPGNVIVAGTIAVIVASGGGADE